MNGESAHIEGGNIEPPSSGRAEGRSGGRVDLEGVRGAEESKISARAPLASEIGPSRNGYAGKIRAIDDETARTDSSGAEIGVVPRESQRAAANLGKVVVERSQQTTRKDGALIVRSDAEMRNRQIEVRGTLESAEVVGRALGEGKVRALRADRAGVEGAVLQRVFVLEAERLAAAAGVPGVAVGVGEIERGPPGPAAW